MIVKAFKYLGCIRIALLIMVLLIPLVGHFMGFTQSPPWLFWLPSLIPIPFLIIRLNKSQKLLGFFSLYIFYAMYVRSWDHETRCPNGEYTINHKGMIFYK